MIILAGGAAAVLIVIFLARRISVFRENYKYVDIEINRTVGHEREKWIREKKRLWLTLLPFSHSHHFHN